MFVLISPPMLFDENSSLFLGRRGTAPMSLAYLASVLEKNEVEYDIIDSLTEENISTLEDFDVTLFGISIENIVNKITEKVEMVGITSMFSSEWPIVSELCKKLRAKYPKLIIIVGGEHPTVDYECILKFEPAIDICFLGESDHSFDLFLKSHKSGDIYKTPGIAFRDKQNKIQVNEGERIKDINDLIPSWKKIDMSFYHNNQLSSSALKKRSMPILASRGCPYQCTFCTNIAVWGNRYFMREISEVISEMKYYQDTYQVSHFDFLDMSMNINKKWFLSLVEAMIKHLPGITWQMEAGSRSEILDHEVLSKMYLSGNRIIDYAPETGSEAQAKRIKKRLNYDNFYKSVKTAISLNFLVKTNLIIGFPDETFFDIFKTIMMALKLGLMGARGVVVFLYSPMIGTPLSNSQNLYANENLKEYNARVAALAGVTCVKVFNLKTLFSNPKRELLAILANTTMVLAYFLSFLKYPRNLYSFIKNIFNKSPEGPFEMAFFMMLTKYKIIKQ